tara:strand:+ start:1571 stop:1780 length:210 start_codon:yes stop_codon:yes gene_type:complete
VIIFDYEHYRGKYWEHLKRGCFISGLFIVAGLLGLVHSVTRFFLPQILSEANKRIGRELEQKFCECPPE